MALTDEQLEQIKDKMVADQCRPLKAIKELFPDENAKEVRQQLFDKYGRTELLELVGFNVPEPTPVIPETPEQELTRINKKLERIEQRKTQLETRKSELEG